MADEFKEFSREEAMGTIYHGGPQAMPSVQQASSVEQPAIKSNGIVAPPKIGLPKAQAPSLMDPAVLAKTVSEAAKTVKESTPAPQATSPTNALADEITSNWKTFATGAAIGAGAMAAPSLIRGGKKLVSKAFEKKTEYERVEPVFATPEETAAHSAQQPTVDPVAAAREKSAQLAGAIQPAAPVVPGAVAPQALEAPTQPSVSEAVATGQNPTKAIQQDVAQLVDQAAAPAVAEVAPVSESAPPPGKKKGRPAGAKNLTAEERLAREMANVPPGMTKQEAGMMNHLLGLYGGKDNPFAQQAYEQVKQILGYTPAYAEGQKGGSLSAEEKGKILDWRKESIPGPKVNLTHEMKGVLKKGGAAAIAAMLLTPEFAKASTTEKRQVLGEALLPLGVTPSEAGAPTLPPEVLQAQRNAMLLGSPYAGSAEAEMYRRSLKPAGAGRGVAPPSMYQR